MPAAPVASCAKVESTRVVATGSPGVTRHSLRNGFNGLLRALPGDRALLPPSPARRVSLLGLTSPFRKLDASVGASGPHGFAVRGRVIRLVTPPRPPHPAPNVRDDREAPLL
jgi:hypothetical protein